jgi:fanconi-associated nuclease 1
MWQYGKDLSKQQAKKRWLKSALETCELGLQDPDSHVIFHAGLQKRLLRLERTLCIPRAEQHTFAHVSLRPPTQREFSGVRVGERDVGKHSSWQSARDPEKLLSVECLCLEHYETLGWKGFHSENGVITTIVPPPRTKPDLVRALILGYFIPSLAGDF